MENKGNRVINDLVKWMAEENELKEKFGKNVDNKPHYLREQLKYYKSIKEKYAGTQDPAERRTLNVLKGEIKDLEKKVYPKLIWYVMKGYDIVSTTVYLLMLPSMLLADRFNKWTNAQSTKDGKAIESQRMTESKGEKQQVSQQDKTSAKSTDQSNTVKGPDRDLRSNNQDMARNNQERVRMNYDDDLPLLPKRSAQKAPDKSLNGESLLPKLKESNGKGMKL